MLNKKQGKFLLVAIVLFSMIAVYGQVSVPTAKATWLTNIKDTISDSDLSASATHVITFNSATTTGANGYYEINFNNALFGIITATTTVACQGGVDAATTTDRIARCTYTSELVAGQATTTITGITNPNVAADYSVVITLYDSNDVELETGTAKIYVIDDVTMTASVDSTLSFAIAGVDNGTSINGITTTATSTATTTPFGTIDSSASSTVGQALTVSTNATNGFVVTVDQSDELKNAAGASINSFNNSPEDTGSTTAQSWAAPAGTIGSDHTYGHMGLSSDDSDYFSADQYAGLNDTDAMAIFSHSAAVDGTVTGQGTTQVAYTVEISDLQEAGDYSTTLTYICTPTY